MNKKKYFLDHAIRNPREFANILVSKRVPFSISYGPGEGINFKVHGYTIFSAFRDKTGMWSMFAWLEFIDNRSFCTDPDTVLRDQDITNISVITFCDLYRDRRNLYG